MTAQGQIEGRLIVVPLNQLHISADYNARPNDTTDVSELAALLESQGQLQNLMVLQEAPGFGIIGGGRRYRSFKLLESRGKIPEDHPIFCLEIPEELALAASVAENTGREPMHPADEFEAFKRLVAKGVPIEDIAAQFGCTPLVVRRRLQLAKVSPKLIALYRTGEMNLDTLQAFTLADSIKVQEKTWNALQSYQRNAYQVRRALTQDKTDVASSRAAQFVGLDAYERAGGALVRDLFGGENSGYIADPELMQRLADEKIEGIAAGLRAEGWSFVKVYPELGYSERERYGRSKATVRELTTEEAVELAQLEAAIAAANEKLHDDDGDEVDDAEAIEHSIAVQEARLAEIKASVATYSDRQKKKAGAVLGLNQAGQLEIHRGMIEPEDPKIAKAKELAKAKAAASDAGEPEPAGLSESLVRKLSANRTAAMAAHLLECPRVALDLLCASLAADVLYSVHHYGPGVVIRPQQQIGDLHRQADDLEGSKAAEAIKAKSAELRALMPESADALFDWLGQQDASLVIEILCFCTSSCLNAVTSAESQRPQIQLEETIGLDMADWWQPTAKSFLGQVPKAVIRTALADVGFAEDKLNELDKLKKGDLVKSAESLLAESRWLPTPLRGKLASTGKPASKKPIKKATAEPTTPAKTTPAKNSAPVKKAAPAKKAASAKKTTAQTRHDAAEQQAAAEQLAATPVSPVEAWPFPTGARP